MGISRRFQQMLRFLVQPVAPDTDQELDALIQAALRDDPAGGPSLGAWDRLRISIVERGRMHRRGMWVLDEPFRDPPAPALLSALQLANANSFRNARTEDLRRQGRELGWSQLMPPVARLLNV